MTMVPYKGGWGNQGEDQDEPIWKKDSGDGVAIGVALEVAEAHNADETARLSGRVHGDVDHEESP